MEMEAIIYSSIILVVIREKRRTLLEREINVKLTLSVN